MAIKFICPTCQARYQVKDEDGGRVGPCPKCAAQIRIPYPYFGSSEPQMAELVSAKAPEQGTTPETFRSPAPIQSRKKCIYCGEAYETDNDGWCRHCEHVLLNPMPASEMQKLREHKESKNRIRAELRAQGDVRKKKAVLLNVFLSGAGQIYLGSVRDGIPRLMSFLIMVILYLSIFGLTIGEYDTPHFALQCLSLIPLVFLWGNGLYRLYVPPAPKKVRARPEGTSFGSIVIGICIIGYIAYIKMHKTADTSAPNTASNIPNQLVPEETPIAPQRPKYVLLKPGYTGYATRQVLERAIAIAADRNVDGMIAFTRECKRNNTCIDFKVSVGQRERVQVIQWLRNGEVEIRREGGINSWWVVEGALE